MCAQSSLTTLFIDFNAYFASVEQQLRPELRGRPIAVGPVMHDSGCCIATSYEAKAFGVKTGTRVYEAKRLCPQIEIVPARPRLYVRMHHRLLAAIDRFIPVNAVHSIDEVSCLLDRTQRDPASAVELARRIKRSVAEHAGEWMRCSIGIAPNRFIAKVATDMHKPDGLVVIERHELPQRLYGLKLIDLPGIGARMSEHLSRAGIYTVQQLAEQSEEGIGNAWGSIVGRRWWHWLRGEDLEGPPTTRRTVGHQHVLPPKFRTDEGARAVAFRLLHKAAARLRHLGYAARRLNLSLRYVGDGSTPGWQRGSWNGSITLGAGCEDTPSMLEALGRLWATRQGGTPMQVGVTLHDLVPPRSQSAPLFAGEGRRASLSRAMDEVNARFGANTVYMSTIHESRHTGSGGIAFTYVPDLDVTDTVRDSPGSRADEELLLKQITSPGMRYEWDDESSAREDGA